eukprot:9097525-Pyramimonas_sp.AAC.1
MGTIRGCIAAFVRPRGTVSIAVGQQVSRVGDLRTWTAPHPEAVGADIPQGRGGDAQIWPIRGERSIVPSCPSAADGRRHGAKGKTASRA